LSPDEKLKQQLAIPDLSETEKLMITLKHHADTKIDARKAEKEALLSELRLKKQAVKDKVLLKG
jgi:hypothetical protein